MSKIQRQEAISYIRDTLKWEEYLGSYKMSVILSLEGYAVMKKG